MRTNDLPRRVSIREVGPRDGLQQEHPLAPEARAEMAIALIRAGCLRIEVASFVSEKAVPAMAGARQVVDALAHVREATSGVVLAALVPNLRGATAALEAGVDELTVTVAASAAYNEKNVRRSIDESVAEIERVAIAASHGSVPVDAVVSCAFGSPFEEESVSPGDVARLVRRLLEGGCAAITLADTTGLATPVVLENVLEELSGLSPTRPGLHLHETRGTAMANAYAALGLGIDRFDTSIGGLGGSPFAPGAGGNLATEDFAAFLGAMGIETGIDLTALLQVGERLEQFVGHPLASKVRGKP